VIRKLKTKTHFVGVTRLLHEVRSASDAREYFAFAGLRLLVLLYINHNLRRVAVKFPLEAVVDIEKDYLELIHFLHKMHHDHVGFEKRSITFIACAFLECYNHLIDRSSYKDELNDKENNGYDNVSF
jgi:hypothetical protein